MVLFARRLLPVQFADKPDETYYRLAVVTKQDTPRFAPALDNYAIYKKSKAFRELLFHKLLNGERAAYLAPTLSGASCVRRGMRARFGSTDRARELRQDDENARRAAVGCDASHCRMKE